MTDTERTDAALQLRLLGSPSVRSGQGHEEPLPDLLAAFVAYLALEGRPVPRPHLAQLFWPGVGRSRGLQSVRQTLARVRQRLGAAAIEGGDPIRWRPGTVQLDVDRLRSAIGGGRAEEALDLWRGPLLQGFRRPESWEVEDWLDRERARLETALSALVVRAVDRRRSEGDPDSALALLRRARVRLPAEGGLAVLEVETLAESGRIAEAAGAFAGLPEDLPEVLRKRAEQGLPPRTRGRGGTSQRALDGPSSHPDPGPVVPTPAGPREGPWGDISGPGAAPDAGRSDSFVPASRSKATALVILLLVAVGLAGISLGRAWGPSGSPPSSPANVPDVPENLALLFCSDRATDGTATQIFRMSLDGRNKHRITQDPACGAWPQPDGSLLAFVHPDPDDRRTRIARYRPHPTNPLAEWNREWVDPEPRIRGTRIASNRAADGTLIFPAQDASGQWDLYRISAGGDSIVRLTDDAAVERTPSVDPRDPDGPVVFTRFERTGPDERTIMSGPADLYALPRSGGTARRLTRHPAVDQLPVVRGDSVVFVRGRGTGDEDGRMELILLDLTTGREEQLTRNDWNDYIPRFSPDGTHICWQSEEYGHYEGNIRIMDLRTREERVLVDDPGREDGCFWSPDGRGVLYRGWGTGQADVRIAWLDRDTTLALTRLDSHDSANGVFIDVPPPTVSAEDRK